MMSGGGQVGLHSHSQNMTHNSPSSQARKKNETALMSLTRRLLFLLFLSVTLAGPGVAQHTSTVVLVVRHADKDTIPKDDPPLTVAGVVRAKALATALAHSGVQAVITTQLIRSQQTGRPLADALGVPMITVPRGTDIGPHASAVAAEVRRQRGKTVLVVGHGETVGPIIAALGGPQIAEVCASEYSNLYTLVLDADDKVASFIQSTYGAPSPPHTSPCGSR
jgi:broad specificity phosphatase PhoE